MQHSQQLCLVRPKPSNFKPRLDQVIRHQIGVSDCPSGNWMLEQKKSMLRARASFHGVQQVLIHEEDLLLLQPWSVSAPLDFMISQMYLSRSISIMYTTNFM